MLDRERRILGGRSRKDRKSHCLVQLSVSKEGGGKGRSAHSIWEECSYQEKEKNVQEYSHLAEGKKGKGNSAVLEVTRLGRKKI